MYVYVCVCVCIIVGFRNQFLWTQDKKYSPQLHNKLFDFLGQV